MPGHWIWMVMLLLLRLSLTAGPLQILNQIPRDGELLKFGAFATSPASPGGEFGASPLDTPRSAVGSCSFDTFVAGHTTSDIFVSLYLRFGSSLSPSMLMSPVGSPYQYQE